MEAQEEIAGALAELYVLSLDMGEVPKAWRVANFMPLLRIYARKSLKLQTSVPNIGGRQVGKKCLYDYDSTRGFWITWTLLCAYCNQVVGS